jgi:branched-chain amino acid transport system substrate-binding protein
MDEKVLPRRGPADAFNVYGYTVAQTLVHLLTQCGDNLTPENVMKQAAHLDALAADASAGNQS